MGKFFRRKRYANLDYTESMMPTTRKEVFIDVLKLNYKRFVLYGLLFLFLSLPFHIIGITEDVLISQMQQSAQGFAEEQQLQLQYDIATVRNLASVIRIPFFVILSLGIAGFARVIRQYAWEDNVIFTFDFWTGVKQNAKQCIVLGTMAGIGYAICTYILNLSIFEENEIIGGLMMLPLGLSAVVLIPVFAFAVVCLSVYSSKTGKLLANSFFLVCKNPIKTLAILICCMSPIILYLIPNFICHIVGRVIFGLAAPFIFLGWYCYALCVLDKYVNKTAFPELYKKGLYHEEDEAAE